MKIHTCHFYTILGKRIDDPEVIDFLRLLHAEPGVVDREYTFSYLYPEYGMEIKFDKEEDRLSTIFLVGANVSSRLREYTGEFPSDIDFQCTRSDVNTRLGPPTYSGGDVYSEDLGRFIPPWDRYDTEDIVIHYDYLGHDKPICRITMMATDMAPELD